MQEADSYESKSSKNRVITCLAAVIATEFGKNL